MAASVTENKAIILAGGPEGRLRVVGTCITTAPTTSIVIQPGEDTTNVDGSRALRRIDSWGFSNSVSSNGFQVVKTYDATHDGDILTVTCTTTDGFNFWCEGPSS